MSKPLNLNSPKINKSCFYILSYLFSEAGYNIINIPLLFFSKKSTEFLTFAIDDSAENVWIGAMNISCHDFEHIINKAKCIINETIGNEIAIQVNGILIKPHDIPKATKQMSYSESQNTIQSDKQDSYILIFKNIDAANEYLQSNKNRTEEDITHLPSAIEFYENVIEYLNKNA